MRLRQFLRSKTFYKQLGLSIIITIILVWITLQALRLYTNHGEEIRVPNLYNLSLKKSKVIIEKTKLRYTIYDSIYNPDLPSGYILEQNPKANSLVKRNRNLFLTINSFKPEQVRFPNLIDNSFRQAYEILITNGFKIGKLNYIDSDFYNLVLYPEFKGDTIKQGDLINKGSRINLVLGKGKNIEIQIPELIGEYCENAKERIILSNLNIGTVNFDHNVFNQSDSLNAQVYKQSHNNNEELKVAPGTKINLWLTTDSLKIKNAQAYIQNQHK